MIAEALLRGLSALFRPRLLLIYWSTSVLLSLGVAAGHHGLTHEAYSQLPDPQALSASTSSPWVEDFAAANGPALTVLSSAAGVSLWLWLLVTTLLAGGLVRAFERRAETERRERGERWDLRTFLGDAGRFAFRMLRLFALTLVMAFALDWLFNDKLASWHDETLVAIESERLSVLTDWLRQGLFALALFLLATWTDFARVQVVLERRNSVLAGLVSAAEAITRRPVEVLGLGGFFVALEWLAMVLAAMLLSGLRTDSMEQLAWWMLGAQLLVILRLGLGFARIAAYTAIGEDLREERQARLSPGVSVAD